MSQDTLLPYVLERLPAPSEKAKLEEIAKGAGVPYHTLLKVAKGETSDPRVSTIDALIRYFKTIRAKPCRSAS